MTENEKVEYEAQIKRFDKVFAKISKKIRNLNRGDQTKMIKLIVARFDYEKQLKVDELKVFSLFHPK